jgi:rhamnosyl/mannosyltransferase
VFARQINVCHFGKFYPPAAGGIESHVQTLARAQARAGASVRVVCVNHRNRDGHDVTWSRYGMTATVEEVDHADRDLGRGGAIVRVTRLGRSASVARFDVIPGLPRLLLDLQYSPVDIVHLHTPNPTMLLTLAALRLNKPIVITHHSDVVNQKWLVHVMRPLEKIVYGRAAAVIATSDAYADASDVLRRYEDKVVIVPLGSELSPFLDPSSSALREAARWRERFCADGAPLWLCVGRCVYYKGFDTAIAALRHVPGRLLIIGEGPLAKTLKRQAQEQGVADRVAFHGRATDDELAGAYLAATALWFPSNARSEAFGLVQVEAMAAGCPVINSHIPGSGVSWVCPEGQGGLTVPMNDPRALAAAANRMLDEPDLRPRLASAGRSRASRELDADRAATRALAVYGRVLSKAAFAGRVQDAVVAPSPRLSRWVKRCVPPVEAGEGAVGGVPS